MKLAKINNQGFSLLEIIIALAIMATAFTVLLGNQAASFLSAERATMMTNATFLARQKMGEIEMEVDKDLAKNKFPDEKIEKNGAFEEPFEEFRWKYTIDKVEIPVVEGGEGEQNVLVQSYMKQVIDQISKAVREVKLVIFWGDEDAPYEEQPQISVTTHIVKLK